jgi:chromate transport protein ChrA
VRTRSLVDAMAFSLRGKSDDPPLLRANLPVSTGPASAEEPEPAPAPARKPAAEPKPVVKAPTIQTMTPLERQAAMKGLSDQERRWTLIALILAVVASATIAVFFLVEHTETHTKKGAVTVAPDAMLLAGVVLAFAVLGFFALRAQKRTLVSFALAIIGFAFTLTVAPLGFAYIFFAGWLMWRAYRIQKYGTPNAKEAAKVAATLPPRRQRKAAASAPPTPSGRKPPKPSKRYTPKAPPRKRVPKPVE